jgi:hypothetical protein
MAGSVRKKEEDVESGEERGGCVATTCECSDGKGVDRQATISQTGELNISVLLRVVFVAELALTILFTFM